mmetsp:Transcript_81503/g.174639  ORF Transcript_81503/g.174639 Transcript_81503/m.174639 type:complete len:89 (-) Transcript_81503:1545-1811(-)
MLTLGGVGADTTLGVGHGDAMPLGHGDAMPPLTIEGAGHGDAGGETIVRGLGGDTVRAAEAIVGVITRTRAGDKGRLTIAGVTGVDGA